MKVIGIDPGFGRAGIAVVEKTRTKKETLLYSTCVETAPKENGAEASRHKRIFDIAQEVRACIEKFQPDAMAIETLFFTNNQKTALGVAEARGAIMYEAMRNGLQIFEYTPNQVKVAVTGNGNSDKTSIIKMIPLLVSTTGGSAIFKDALDDEYDAIAVALACLASNYRE